MCEKIGIILEKLALLPHADNLRVFGSMITDKVEPFDIDIGLIGLDCETFSEALTRYADTIRPMLELSRKYYG